LGYEWYYSGHNAAPPEYSGYVRFSHTGDTVLAGRQANLLLHQNFNYSGTITGTTQHIVTQVTDTVFLYREDLDAFTILYIFNQNVGDTIKLDAPFTLPGVPSLTSYRIVIDSITLQNYGGVTLKKYFTSPLDDFYWPGAMIDQIGCTGWFFPSPLVSIPEGPGEIRCFSTPQISINFNSYACDYRLDVNTGEATPPIKIELFPNPTEGILNVFSHENIDLVQIIDHTGKIVLETDQDSINLQSLENGLYIAQVKTKSGKVQNLKITKI
jgi:Secretion system C-terminal sorting domain